MFVVVIFIASFLVLNIVQCGMGNMCIFMININLFVTAMIFTGLNIFFHIIQTIIYDVSEYIGLKKSM